MLWKNCPGEIDIVIVDKDDINIIYATIEIKARLFDISYGYL